VSEERPLRIALCTASVGHGHTRAAHAIADALRQSRVDATVEIVDALASAPAWFVMAYRDAYLAGCARVPAAAGWLYAATDRAPRGGRGAWLEEFALRDFVRGPEVARADAVVCTHFLCGRVLSAARGRGELGAPLTICVTDQHPHGVWLAPRADRVLVASERARETAVRAGMPEERIGVTGIPIDVRFSTPMGRAEARRAMGLPADRPIVLVSGGGLGLGGMEGTVRGLAACGREIHVVAICGHNQGVRNALMPLACAPGAGRASCDVFGFTDHMPTMMRAADVMIGKPGGLSTAEALASGLPMVLIRPIPGQEERNAALLVGHGAAVLERDPRRAAGVAVEVLMSEGRLREMGAACRAVGRADSAMRAAGEVLGTIGASAVRVRDVEGAGAAGGLAMA
jgi:processive 1,2-diacylglycerol beta-glucosyltransferase